MKRLCAYAKKNLGIAAFVVIIALACLFLVLKNIKTPNFLSASLIDIVTIILGVAITLFLTESLNDKRRRNDCIEHIIMEIESFISDDNNFKANPNTLMRQSSCANRIKYIKDAGFPDIKDDIDFIEQHYTEIRDLYSNHYQNETELQGVKKDIDKHRDLIVDKCCKIRVGLYSYLSVSS